MNAIHCGAFGRAEKTVGDQNGVHHRAPRPDRPAIPFANSPNRREILIHFVAQHANPLPLIGSAQQDLGPSSDLKRHLSIAQQVL